MKVLLTGAGGFLGAELVARLDVECDLVMVDSLAFGQYGLVPYLLSYGDFHACDVRGPAFLRLVRGADVVVHLAALVGAPLCGRLGEAATRDVNEGAVRRLARYLSPRQRLVYLNTTSGYGNSGGAECKEEHSFSPLTTYAVTKAEGEKHALDRANSVSLRLATVYGVSPRQRMDLLVQSFAEHLFEHREGRRGPLVVFQGHFTRSLVGVVDVCRAINFFLAGPGRGLCGVHNVASLSLTKLALARKVAGLLGLDPDQAVAEGDGDDPDGRDAAVSSAKLLGAGFAFEQTLEGALPDLEALCEAVPPEARKEMRN